MALRLSGLRAANVSAAPTGALRISRLSVSTTSPASPPSAGLRLVDLEPYSAVSLVGVGDVVGAWSQVAGVGVTLTGSGATRGYSAPATVAGTTLRFTYTVAGQSATVEHVVLPVTEWSVLGGVPVPTRIIMAAA